MVKRGIIICIVVLLIGGFLYWNRNNKQENKESLTKIPKDNTKKLRELDNTIFKKYSNKAEKTLKNMTIEEKVGQLFLVRYSKNDVEYFSNFYPGGYILFAKDIENHTKDSLKKELTENLQKNKYSLILGVDEEGGFVTRVSRYSAFRKEKFLSPKDYYMQGGYELLEQTENEKATLLKEIGFNLNLAPVADISTNPDDFIYSRSFGENAKKTSEYIENMVKYAKNNEISSCLKHFPGYGNNEDTHTGIAIDNRSYEEISQNDYLPFQAGIKEGVPCILVSHNIVMAIDSNLPASLSSNVISELREKLSYTGVIITDDLAMDAVKSYVENKEAATLAINAGNDMIITSDFISMYKEVLNSVKEGKIKEERLNKAVLRIIAWKYSNGLLA